MEYEEINKHDREQTSQLNAVARSAISRRQFSLGVSGIVLAGTILESSEHNTLNALAAKAPTLSSRFGSQKLISQVFKQPQYTLSGTAASTWSPDSQHISAFRENVVTLYNADTGTPEFIYNQHTDEILTVQWSADSQYLASGGFDQIVHVWEALSGRTVTVYRGHSNIVRDIAWSPDQRYIASAGYDKTIQVWEALTGVTVVTCSGHAAEILALTWSPDGRSIASTDLQSKTMIWHVI